MQFVSRRNLLGNCALAVFAVLQNKKPASAQSSRRPAQAGGGQAAALVNHPRGQYSFLPGASAYGNLRAMGVNWPDVTTIDFYTAHDLSEALLAEILKLSGHNAVTWNYARPPILEVEIEMDLRGVRREIVLG
jgi:hypothetical protein